jgi:hypothetical protein
MFAYRLTELFEPPAFVAVVSATKVKVVAPLKLRPAVPEPRSNVTTVDVALTAVAEFVKLVVYEDGVPTKRRTVEVPSDVLLTAVPVKVTRTVLSAALPPLPGVKTNEARASLADFARPEVSPSGDEENASVVRKTFCAVTFAVNPPAVTCVGNVITALLPDVAPCATTFELVATAYVDVAISKTCIELSVALPEVYEFTSPFKVRLSVPFRGTYAVPTPLLRRFVKAYTNAGVLEAPIVVAAV